MTIDLTIGIPVYNGADSIAEALTNLLGQSFGDFHVIVSDNASTDQTAEIVSSVAAKDSRVKLITQPENLGPVGNFRFLAEQAETQLFAWRAHDDVTDDNFLEVLRAKLLKNPDAQLIAPKTVTSKLKGDRERPFSVRLKAGEAANWPQLHHAEAGWMYGMFRTSAAARGAAYAHEHYPHVWGWDYLVILNALFDGGIIGTNETRFIHRLHGPPVKRYDYSKEELRTIFADFYRAGDGLAEDADLNGMGRQYYRAKLARFISRRVVRWQRLIF